ncbi:MAG: AbrB/MazE/SpoVT family DNA-binding domain-containing protein [Elusimicrobia bacterium]|nr:AbrB/MazE/SpoVT family DNA-binding domain-containing protein [Elusimicrobiota bacterium]
MMKRLTKHGHSLALVIDRGVLDLLDINEKTPLGISTDGRVLIVAPVNDSKRRKQFEEALAKSHQKYGRMYKRLAKADLAKAA